MMYGFLNVFVAAVLARKGVPAAELEPVLLDVISELARRDRDEIAGRPGASSRFRSVCSFEEPSPI